VIKEYGELADLVLNFNKNDVALRLSFIAKAHTEGAVSYTILKLNKTDKTLENNLRPSNVLFVSNSRRKNLG